VELKSTGGQGRGDPGADHQQFALRQCRLDRVVLGTSFGRQRLDPGEAETRRARRITDVDDAVHLAYLWHQPA